MKASIYPINKNEVDENGKPVQRKWKLSVGSEGDRKTVYLGAMPKTLAERWRDAVTDYLRCSGDTREMRSSTLELINGVDDGLYDKFAAAGILPERRRRTLGKFIETYKAGKQWKKSSADAFNKSEKHLIEFFGADCPIDSITADQAEDFRTMLVQNGLAPATVSKRIMQVKGVFNAAKRRGLISLSPFEHVVSGSQVNTKRMHYITREEFDLMIDECANSRQRLILTLCRYGGIRIGEIEGLLWKEVNWKLGVFTVHSPKTERYEGKDRRTIKMLPEVEKAFREHYDALPAGTKDNGLVFPDAKPYDRIFISKDVAPRCGLGHLPKIPQNCRSSIGTQLLDEGWSAASVAKFLGNTVGVLLKHYYQFRGYEYGEAPRSDVQNNTASAQTDAKHGAVFSGQLEVIPKMPVSKSKIHGAESGAERGKMPLNPVETGNLTDSAVPAVSQDVASRYNENTLDNSMPPVRTSSAEMGGTGLEPVTPSLSSWCSNQLS